VLALASAGGSGYDDGDEEPREGLRRDADRWVRGIVGADVPPERVRSEVTFGEAGQEILAAAERHDTDLIVTGSHGGGAMRRLVVGSVAAEVLRGATCPVLVVKAAVDELES
jgi:nucleotide-binding universal stress UspA family protein